MLDWWKSKSKIEKLELRYTELMKQSFKLALHDKTKSDRLSKEAEAVLDQIRILKFKQDEGAHLSS